MNIEVVLFDLDGTLLHTVPDLAAAVNAMLADLGKVALPESQVAVYVGKGAENLVHRSLTGSMTELASPADYNKAMAIWQAHYNRINGEFAVLYPGVLEGLNKLKAAGLRLGVVTNKPERYTHPLLKRTGLSSYFDVIVGGDTCERKKPDPMPVTHACVQFKVDPANTLLIGDSINDSLSAKAAGAICWLLPYGYNEGHSVHSTPCDAVVETIDQAADRLLASKVQP